MEKIFAQSLNIGDQSSGSQYTFTGPDGFAFGDGSIGAIVSQAVPYVFAFAGIGLLLMIISSGFTMMLSAGDAKKLEAGRGRLTQSVVGFLIIFAAYWIVQITGTIFGWESIGGSFQ